MVRCREGEEKVVEKINSVWLGKETKRIRSREMRQGIGRAKCDSKFPKFPNYPQHMSYACIIII